MAVMNHPFRTTTMGWTRHLVSKAGRSAWCALFAFTAATGSAQSAQPGALAQPLMRLGGIFPEQTLSMAADVCVKRVPASKAAWADTSQQWQEQHREKLAALKQRQNSFERVLAAPVPKSAPLDLPAFVAYQAQATMLVIYGLATANDTTAATYCDDLRARYLDRPSEDRRLDQALADADLILQALYGR
jgi:hypothetical protein